MGRIKKHMAYRFARRFWAWISKNKKGRWVRLRRLNRFCISTCQKPGAQGSGLRLSGHCVLVVIAFKRSLGSGKLKIAKTQKANCQWLSAKCYFPDLRLSAKSAAKVFLTRVYSR
jgi:hypothetical protein